MTPRRIEDYLQDMLDAILTASHRSNAERFVQLSILKLGSDYGQQNQRTSARRLY